MLGSVTVRDQDECSPVSAVRRLRRQEMACTPTHPYTSPCALEKGQSVKCPLPNCEVIEEGQRNFYPLDLKRQKNLGWPKSGKEGAQTCNNMGESKQELRPWRGISGPVLGVTVFMEWVPEWGTFIIRSDAYNYRACVDESVIGPRANNIQTKKRESLV